jgi:2-dehydropantoate 2-reductase
LLARDGRDVTFIARGRNLDALREQGLTISLLSGEVLRVAVQATDDPRTVGTVDLIWFCVKTYDLVAAAHHALPLVGGGTMALPVQNGVEAHEQLGAILGREHVLGGVAPPGATLVAPGRVEQKSARVRVIFGELDGSGSERAEHVHQLLTKAGIEAIVSPAILVALWEKLMQAWAVFGLNCLLLLPLGRIVTEPTVSELFRGLMREAADVGRARGVPIAAEAVERLWEDTVGLAAGNPDLHSSMYFDMVAGRPLELEAMGGAVVRLGREACVLTPLSFAVYAALTPHLRRSGA